MKPLPEFARWLLLPITLPWVLVSWTLHRTWTECEWWWHLLIGNPYRRIKNEEEWKSRHLPRRPRSAWWDV